MNCFQGRAVLWYLKLALLCNQIRGFQHSLEANRENQSGLGFNKNVLFIMLCLSNALFRKIIFILLSIKMLGVRKRDHM